jgi:hypothetical protein
MWQDSGACVFIAQKGGRIQFLAVEKRRLNILNFELVSRDAALEGRGTLVRGSDEQRQLLLLRRQRRGP